MAQYFGFTLQDIYGLTMSEFNVLVDEMNDQIKEQNEQIKKSRGKGA